MILGLVLAVFVGVTLGLVGSGGSIMTVPILVYIMGVNPVLATTYSLFTIGLTSLIGSIKGIIHKDVDFQKILLFGIPSMITVFIARQYLLPLVPDTFEVGNYVIHQDKLLMLLFALVMMLSAYGIISDHYRKKCDELCVDVTKFKIVLQGVIVGLVTGAVGAGGGFLIIPALVNFFKLSMKKAVSTSLLLIAMNSILGLLGDLEKINNIDWNLLLPYTSLTVLGIFIGFVLSNRIDGGHLKLAFGYMIALVSIFVAINVLVF